LWALGDDSDEDIAEDEDEDEDHHQNPLNHHDELSARRTVIPRSARGSEINEHTGLVEVEPSLVGSGMAATRSRPHW